MNCATPSWSAWQPMTAENPSRLTRDQRIATFLFQALLYLLTIIPCLMLPAPGECVSGACPPFYLKTDTGQIINPISGENADQPYSTRKTCGTCHDVDHISKGYHFAMDWDQAADDRFTAMGTPWRVSTGLTGSMTPYGYYFLAKKSNRFPEEIDLSVFDFIARAPEKTKGFQKPGCAACHAGGGMLERDRDGYRYDLRLAENPALAKSLDGDYYQSRWDQTGVIEPDCFICHGNRYQIQTRIVQMKNLNFKWAGVAASGIGQVYGRVIDGQIPKVVYNKRLFNEDGTFYLPDMRFKPEAESCLFCHESIELGKRGMSWDDPVNPDVHHLAGLTCIDCHPGGLAHNFAKGNAMANTVADDLDNTMRSCRECHIQGYKGAARMKHEGIRADHLDKLSCEACHIPELRRSAAGAMFVNTGVFGKFGQINTQRFGEEKPWKPAFVIRKKDKDGIPRITPVNPMLFSLFTNQETTGIFTPLFLSEVEPAYQRCQGQMSKRDVPYDFHAPGDMILMLKTLALTLDGNRRFSRVFPWFHTGGMRYSLNSDDTLNCQADTSWVRTLPYFSVSHNVAPVEAALGAGGCRDCHAEGAHMFHGRVITDYFGDNGAPKTVSMAEFLNLSKRVQTWNLFFSRYLDASLPVWSAGVACFLMIPVAGLFLMCRQRLFNAWAFLRVMGVMALLLAGHVFVIKDAGIWTTLYKTGSRVSALPGLVLLLVSFAGFAFLIENRIASRRLMRSLQILGVPAVVTGFLLWWGPKLNAGLLFFITGIHGIFSLLMTGILITLLFFPPFDRK